MTLCCVYGVSVAFNFNSHAHVERDIYMGQVVVITGISTHTLTWSVTEPPREITPIVGNFNSHAHVERDDIFKTEIHIANISTHTLTWSVTI